MNKRILQENKLLQKRYNSKFQLIENNMYNFTIEVEGVGFYKNRTIKFIINLPKDYPHSAPDIQVDKVSSIYLIEGKIPISNWVATLGIIDIINRFINTINILDTDNPACGGDLLELYMHNKKKYIELTIKNIRDLPIFDKNNFSYNYLNLVKLNFIRIENTYFNSLEEAYDSNYNHKKYNFDENNYVKGIKIKNKLILKIKIDIQVIHKIYKIFYKTHNKVIINTYNRKINTHIPVGKKNNNSFKLYIQTFTGKEINDKVLGDINNIFIKTKEPSDHIIILNNNNIAYITDTKENRLNNKIICSASTDTLYSYIFLAELNFFKDEIINLTSTNFNNITIITENTCIMIKIENLNINYLPINLNSNDKKFLIKNLAIKIQNKYMYIYSNNIYNHKIEYLFENSYLYIKCIYTDKPDNDFVYKKINEERYELILDNLIIVNAIYVRIYTEKDFYYKNLPPLIKTGRVYSNISKKCITNKFAVHKIIDAKHSFFDDNMFFILFNTTFSYYSLLYNFEIKKRNTNFILSFFLDINVKYMDKYYTHYQVNIKKQDMIPEILSEDIDKIIDNDDSLCYYFKLKSYITEDYIIKPTEQKPKDKIKYLYYILRYIKNSQNTIYNFIRKIPYTKLLPIKLVENLYIKDNEGVNIEDDLYKLFEDFKTKIIVKKIHKSLEYLIYHNCNKDFNDNSYEIKCVITFEDKYLEYNNSINVNDCKFLYIKKLK